MSESIVPQRTDQVFLFRDDDQRELERLNRAVQTAAAESVAAQSDEPVRLGDIPAVREAARAYDKFKAEAREQAVVVNLKAMPGRQWRRIVGEHPPRENHEADADWGFNHLALADVVVAPCIASIGGAELAGDDLEAELDKMSDGDFSKVYSHVLALNTGRGPDPFDSISERLPRSSPETSESPDRLG